jgi:hypothetical protein
MKTDPREECASMKFFLVGYTSSFDTVMSHKDVKPEQSIANLRPFS